MNIIVNTPTVNPSVARIIKELDSAHLGDSNPSMPPKVSTVRSIRTIWSIDLREAKELYEAVLEDKPLSETCLPDKLNNVKV